MPKFSFRRQPSAHGSSSLIRYLFPQTQARARTRLSHFRHNTLHSLKQRAQSRIYKYLVYRQALKLKGKQNVLQRLRGRTRRFLGGSDLENEARLRRDLLANAAENKAPDGKVMTYQESYAQREPGGRRRKLAGYLKAANELRQTYTEQYAPNWSSKEASYEHNDDTPSTFPDAAIVRSGEEEMILFPSYARKHIKRKPEAQPGTIQEVSGEGRDVRDSTGAGDAEFWKQQWENYEDDNAVVDVDVRGWIYSPHKGQMTRKQRLFIGLARQLVGVSAPPAASTLSSSSRDPSPSRHGFRERAHLRDARRDEEFTAREAEQILRRGQKEAETAAKGAYSEKPAQDLLDDTQLYRTESKTSVRTSNASNNQQLSHRTSNASLDSIENIKPVQKRASWQQPSDMSAAELAEANARLMARLRHFLAMPMANAPISVFFYNDKISKQRTVYTDASGHFSMSAALDFVPTTVRILASDKLSATEEVIVTGARGISVISDIDDTIKHSAIGSGAREIFRNVFIRDLYDLTIDGVREWYNRMAEMGVKFHYVSNSPWQLYPLIAKYFSLAGLPPGSFHLKQYSGMLQGIFEPVAERKKVTLDKIARDFPDRRFILVGDSGEADLEVYTDFVLENPGRVVAVFIRDVTTTDGPDFFDPSSRFGPENKSGSPRPSVGNTTTARRPRPLSEDDPELSAAIVASLRDMEEDNVKRSGSILPHVDQDHPHLRPKLPDRKLSLRTSSSGPQEEPIPNLIELSSDDEPCRSSASRHINSDTKVIDGITRSSDTSVSNEKSAPPLPKKPVTLRTLSSDARSSSGSSIPSSRPPPPKPRKPSAGVNPSSPLAQHEAGASDVRAGLSTKPPVGPKPNLQNDQLDRDQQSYAGMARDKLWSVYNTLPAIRSQDGPTTSSASLTSGPESSRKAPPPPPPPRRGNRETAANAASYVGSKASAAWQHAPSIPYHSRPQLTSAQTSQPISAATPRQNINRTNTGSTLNSNLGNDQYGTKREQLWRQRWTKAEQILTEQGVMLKSWRVGSDVAAEAEKLVEDNDKKWKNADPKSE
ncbi:hypothetical protein ACN47E_010010 [Coniothyrium glycines]